MCTTTRSVDVTVDNKAWRAAKVSFYKRTEASVCVRCSHISVFIRIIGMHISNISISISRLLFLLLTYEVAALDMIPGVGMNMFIFRLIFPALKRKMCLRGSHTNETVLQHLLNRVVCCYRVFQIPVLAFRH